MGGHRSFPKSLSQRKLGPVPFAALRME